jgi:sodium-dependent dicarboxylate transporter 2/3/5
MMESGACDWMAAQLTFLAHVPGWLGILLIALIALGLTTAASNTASAAILIPLAIPLAHVIHVNPVKLVIIVAIATSVDFALVIGTPPTMIAYSTELFTTKEIFKRGFALDLIGIGLLVTVVVGCWHILGIL